MIVYNVQEVHAYIIYHNPKRTNNNKKEEKKRQQCVACLHYSPYTLEKGIRKRMLRVVFQCVYAYQ